MPDRRLKSVTPVDQLTGLPVNPVEQALAKVSRFTRDGRLKTKEQAVIDQASEVERAAGQPKPQH